MRTFNISFLAVLSCIVMIGATPIRNNVDTCSRNKDITLIDGAIAVKYVALQQLMEVLP